MSVPTAEKSKAEKKIVKMPLRKAAGKRLVRSDRSTAVRLGDGPSAERRQQNGGIVKEYEPESPKSRVMLLRYKAKCECQLDYYLHMQKIDVDEHKAGMQFRDAWLIKAEGIKTRDASTTSQGSGKPFDPYQDKTWAEKVLDQVFKETGLSTAQVQVILKVCGSDQRLGNGVGVKTLRRALEKMARFWNFI